MIHSVVKHMEIYQMLKFQMARLRLMLWASPAAIRSYRVARRPLADARDVRRTTR